MPLRNARADSQPLGALRKSFGPSSNPISHSYTPMLRDEATVRRRVPIILGECRRDSHPAQPAEGRAHRARVLRRPGHFGRGRVDPRARAGFRAVTRPISASTTSRTSRPCPTARRSTARRSRGSSTAASCSRTRASSRCSAARSTSPPAARRTSTPRPLGPRGHRHAAGAGDGPRRREHLGRRLDVQGQ